MFFKISYKKYDSDKVYEKEIELKNNSFKSNDFVINSKETKEKEELLLEIKVTEPIEIINISLRIQNFFSTDDKIFMNGYQSWTDSYEVSVKHKDKIFSPIIKKVVDKYKFRQYGDYNFYKAKNKKGIFHSVNYSYITQNKNEVFFIGSLNDNKAFTFIEFNCPENYIEIKRDFEGKIISSKEDIFHLYLAKGNKKELLDKYFNLNSYVEKPKKIMRGWTSWYNYYEDISEEIIIKNLRNFEKEKIKIDYFQIDDGYQNAVGDWLLINKKFPKGMDYIASEVKKAGYKVGIWLAPFSAEKKSELVKNHPDWILKDEKGEFVYGGSNWSSFYALDIYNKEFRTYLKEVFRTLIEDWGYEMFKLDFLYSACLLPRKTKTRAEVMADAMDFLREIIGDKEILACGVPIYSSWGKVDYCRIGCDIGLDWDDKFFMKYFHRERISTKNAIKNSIGRYHLDGKVFYNDPDVFLLRNDNLSLSKKQKETLFWVNNLFGTLIFTSDDISEYNREQKDFYMKSFDIKTKEILEVEENNELYKIKVRLNDKLYIFLINLKEKNQRYKKNIIGAFETLYFEMEE